MLKAPFPYFGGKRSVAHIIWERFGRVTNYVEPFCGSAAVLLARPEPIQGTESVGDLDGQIVNVWRALKQDAEAVASYCMDPPNSLDMGARGDVLTAAEGQLPKQLLADPDWCDPRLAGYWIYCQACWLNGVESARGRVPMPRLWRYGMGVARYRDDRELLDDLKAIERRLRYVRVAYGDWKRLTTTSALQSHGLSCVFLDPPYGVEDRYTVYTQDSRSVSKEVYDWALANEDDPLLKIAVAGYEGEHDFPETWSVVKWTSHGFVGKAGSRGRENRERERLWFSPACLGADAERTTQLALNLAGATGIG